VALISIVPAIARAIDLFQPGRQTVRENPHEVGIYKLRMNWLYNAQIFVTAGV